MLEELLNIFFPPICAICGKITKNWICPKCYLKIKPELKYKKLSIENIDIYFLGFYEKTIKKLILKFKFKDEAYIGKMFAYLILKNPDWNNKLKQYDYIISVPMYNQNKRLRGYTGSWYSESDNRRPPLIAK
jgi:predicted amidophosphoribosyltransferase